MKVLKTIFKPKDDDPLMYGSYEINEGNSDDIKKHVDFKFEFDKYDYSVDCYQA